MNKNLYVVTCVSNPIRFKSRYRLYQDFARRVKAAGAILCTVEQAFGDRDFQITGKGTAPIEVQVRSFHELWHKENMINLGIARLPKDWEYVAWLDADIQFVRENWVEETIQQLQHYMFVQMFSNAVDLGPGLETVSNIHNGFVWSWAHGKKHGAGYHDWHPGYAWAARREAYEYVGKLLDLAILGSGDRHMAGALIGKVEQTYNHRVHPNYIAMCQDWQFRCEKYIMRDIGYVSGLLLHHWHGKKKDRQYVDRWKILVDSNYDPFVDVRFDKNGMLELNERNPKLRDGVRRYFRSRNEDSIDVG